MSRRTLSLLLIVTLATSTTTRPDPADYATAAFAGSVVAGAYGAFIAICKPFAKEIIADTLTHEQLQSLANALLSMVFNKYRKYILENFEHRSNERANDLLYGLGAAFYFLALHHVGDTLSDLPELSDRGQARDEVTLFLLSLTAGGLMGATAGLINKFIDEQVQGEKKSGDWGPYLASYCVAQPAAGYAYISCLWKYILSGLPLKGNVLATDALGVGYHASGTIAKRHYSEIKTEIKKRFFPT